MIKKIALALTTIGALNWGVVGIFRFDVVAQLANGSAVPFARLIYILIGISALFNLSLLFQKVYQADKDVVEV